MQPDRREKVAALLHSPIAGERDAARAALDRMPTTDAVNVVPVFGSKEWHDARVEWHRKIQFCESRLGSPILKPSEVVTVRNWARGIGSPWERGADDLVAIYEKLRAAESA